MSTFRAKQLIAKSVTIPTLPAIIQKVEQMLKDPKIGTREIGTLVAEDPPLAAKVLKISNSAYYGLREHCVSTEQASAVLGLRVLRNVVTQAAVMKQFDHLKTSGFDMDELWKHSVLVAQVVRAVAQRSTRKFGFTPDEFYTCGLLHDLGKVVLLESMTEEFLGAVARSKAENMPLHVCEEQALGFNHTDVGSLIAIHWGLPTSIAAAIQYHHGPREAIERDAIVALVANVNLLVHRAADGNLVAAASVIDARTAALLGITPQDVTELVNFVEQTLSAPIEV